MRHSTTGATPSKFKTHRHLFDAALFHFRRRSLVRGTLLVLGSLAMAIPLSHFPHNHATPLLAFPVILSIIGTVDTTRCLQRRWSFYHAGVILLIYMDLMVISMVLFFLLYPYFH